ncbi:MAG: hypothetical protein KBB21_11220 [Nannocystaceae bacterium]|nr:hypothetical protein [Nannocystaceae bacterium]
MLAAMLRSLPWALVPALVAFVLAPRPAAPWWALAWLCVAFVASRPWRRPAQQRGATLVAVVLAAAAALAAARARGLVDVAYRDDWPHVDLSQTNLEGEPPTWLEVAGVLRDAWVLGEYRVGEGELPDQSKAADAVLIPMTGRAGAIVTGGAVVVARVRSDHPRGEGVVVLRGHTEALAPELAATLVDLGGQASAPVRGVLLDTLQVPQHREAVTAAIVAAALALAAWITVGVARRRDGGVLP